MVHTAQSQRQVVESMLKELSDYGRSLREEERIAFNSLLAKAKLHIASISFACSYNAWALVLFSMLLEQEKIIIELQKRKEV